MPKRPKDPATGRFLRRRTDDSYDDSYDAINARWQERNQENEERMRMEREDEDAARPPRMRICINGPSSKVPAAVRGGAAQEAPYR